MTVLVGYIPDQYGEAALAAGHRGGPAPGHRPAGGQRLPRRRAGRQALPRRVALAELEPRLADLGVAHEVRQPVGVDAAEDMLRRRARPTPR